MKISSNETIAGYPIMQVRELLKRVDPLNTKSVSNRLGITSAKAQKLLDALVELGYLETEQFEGRTLYQTSVKGNSLAMANTGAAITREKAQKIFDEFMQRVAEVNENDFYLYRVTKVLLFGSFLKDVPTVNDVDIAFELTTKEMSHKKFLELNQQRVDEAIESGKRFSSYTDKMIYSHTLAIKYLKSGVKRLSLHTTDDKILEKTETKQVFP